MHQEPPPEEQRSTGLRDVPRPEKNQSPQGQASFTDSSGPLFHMYIKMTEGEDDKMAKRWQKDADGILIFTGLFSAALAALSAVSVQDLKPNPQDTSAFYLGNIYKLLADPNMSRESILAIPAQPPPFSPPRSAVWVNSLWFLSLVISLTCALLATMLQQWARRYVTITQPSLYSPHKRATIREFFANGVDRFHLPWSVEALPALLHLSLFLFFSGLGVFLFNINHTVFSVVIWWVGLTGAAYGCITWMPIFWNDSPYYSPLSSSMWLFYAGIQYGVSHIVLFLWSHNCTFIAYMWPDTYRTKLFRGMTKAVQDSGSRLSAEINSRILTWIIHSLDEDKDLEQFIEAIPGFCGSSAVRYSYPDFDPPQLAFAKVDKTLAWAFYSFIGRILTSSSTSEANKKRCIVICAKATDSAHLTYSTIFVLERIFAEGVEGFQSVEIGRSLRISDDGGPGLCSQGIIAGVIASVPERDDRWVALAVDQLGVSEEVLRDYLANGDSVLLANFIYITRPLFHLCLNDVSTISYGLTHIFSVISKFDIRNTLPRLQHEFCALWNEIGREAHTHGRDTIYNILKPIRHLYIALHPGTDAIPTYVDPSLAPLYPLCNNSGHRPDTVIDEMSDPNVTPDSPSSIDRILPSLRPWSADHRGIHFAEQPSPHDVPDATDYTNNVDLSVVSDIPPSSPPLAASAPNDAVPANIRSSLTSPAFRIDQVTALDPLPLLSTSTTAIFPAPLEGTSVDVLDQSQGSATVPDVTADVLRHPLDTAPVSRDIDPSE